jgi:hypothetical protein
MMHFIRIFFTIHSLIFFEMIDINVFCNCESYGLKCIYINFFNTFYFNENDITWMLMFLVFGIDLSFIIKCLILFQNFVNNRWIIIILIGY